MLSIILSHLLAALVPFILLFLFIQNKQRRQYSKNRREFWLRQSPEELKYLHSGNSDKIPAPLNLLGELESLQTAVQTVSLAIELGLIEFMAQKKEATMEQIVEFLGFSPRQVYSAVEVLLASCVFKKDMSCYSLTERARVYLLKESPFFEPLPFPTLAKRFLKVMKRGVVKGAVEKWGKGKANVPEKWAIKQHAYSLPLGFALHNSGLLQNRKKILDVAGGTGAVCIGLALQNPSPELQLIELPGSIKIAERMIAKYQLSDRITCIDMDMFVEKWPDHLDAILFTNIFHDWDDEHCTILSQKAYAALNPGGLIIIQEALLNDDAPGPLWTAHWSMAMALVMRGRQFHGSELKKIVKMAGFTDIKIHPLLGYYSSVAAVKPNPN